MTLSQMKRAVQHSSSYSERVSTFAERKVQAAAGICTTRPTRIHQLWARDALTGNWPGVQSNICSTGNRRAARKQYAIANYPTRALISCRFQHCSHIHVLLLECAAVIR